MNRAEAFVRLLAEKYSALQPLLAEHLDNNFGEVLPHVFFEDVTSWIVLLTTEARTDPDSKRQLADVLEHLEEAYLTGDEGLENLLCASFLESLPGREEPGGEVRGMLGKTLRAKLRAIELG